MTHYGTLEELNYAFKSGRFRLEDNITIGHENIEFRFKESVVHPLEDMVKKNYKMFVIYSITPASKNSEIWPEVKQSQQLFDWVVLMWTLNTNNLFIYPTRVASNTPQYIKPYLQSGEKGGLAAESLQTEGQQTISDIVELKFPMFANKVVKGKVDTGAHMSSLHAENWKVDRQNNKVIFSSSIFTPGNQYTMPLADQHSVKTSDNGIENRPAIAMDIVIAGKPMSGVIFNLNDRSQMEDKILVGQNILEKGGFLVDPSQQMDHDNGMPEGTEIDVEALQEMYQNITYEESPDEKRIDELYRSMLESNISFKQIVEHFMKHTV